MNFKAIAAGAVSGFASAVVVDLNAWSKAPEGSAFSWVLAFKRWVAGAITGALAALGIGDLGA